MRLIEKHLSISPDTIEEIMIELREGTPLRKIGKMFGYSERIIKNVNEGTLLPIPGFRYPIRSKYTREPSC
jgi:hypothetical protein